MNASRFHREMTLINGDVCDLTKQKEELVIRLTKQLVTLTNDRTLISDQSTTNDLLGTDISSVVANKVRPSDSTKFRSYVDDVGHITMLLLSLSGRLARTENSLFASTDATEKVLKNSSSTLASRWRINSNHFYFPSISTEIAGWKESTSVGTTGRSETPQNWHRSTRQKHRKHFGKIAVAWWVRRLRLLYQYKGKINCWFARSHRSHSIARRAIERIEGHPCAQWMLKIQLCLRILHLYRIYFTVNNVSQVNCCFCCSVFVPESQW